MHMKQSFKILLVDRLIKYQNYCYCHSSQITDMCMYIMYIIQYHLIRTQNQMSHVDVNKAYTECITVYMYLSCYQIPHV